MTREAQGFTLIEMAVVLLIVGLLLGGLLQPLANRMEQERRRDTTAYLENVQEALVGFALVNGRLPCPDTDGDGVENTTGCQNLSTTFNSGDLPWATLGVASADAWGGTVSYAVNGAFTTTFSLTTSGGGAGVLSVYDSAATGCSGSTGQVAVDVPAIFFSDAKRDFSSSDEQENRDGDACFIDRDYSAIAGSEFDDLVNWVAPTILFNRMVAAGRLP